MQYFFFIWVVKYSTGWGPSIGGCESFWKVLWTGMTNCADFFSQNPFLTQISNHNGIVKRLLFILGSAVHFGEHCSFWGALFILGSTVHEQKPLYYIIGSPIRTVLPKMNGGKILLHLLFGWSLDKDQKSLDQSKQIYALAEFKLWNLFKLVDLASVYL